MRWFGQREEWVRLDPGQQGKLNTLEYFRPVMIRVNDHRILVVRLKQGVSAVNNICPHAGAALHAGYCSEKGIISCPLHHYKFDIRTGRSTDGSEYRLRIYPLEKREDGWHLRL